MPESFHTNFFASGYYVFANGILLITLAAVLHGFDRELTRRFNLKWLAAGLFASGTSRILASLGLLRPDLPVFAIESGFIILTIHFYFEYIRREWSQNENSPARHLHWPILMVLIYGFYLSGNATSFRSLLMASTGILVSLTGLRATRSLPQEVVAIARGCFALAITGFLINTLTLYKLRDGVTAEARVIEPFVSEWALILPSLFIVAITTLAMLGRHIREKLHWHRLRGDLGLISHLLFLTAIVLLLVTGPVIGNRMEKQTRFQREAALSQAIESLAQLINHRMLMAANYSAVIAAAPGILQYLEDPDPDNHEIIENYLAAIAPKNPDGMCFLTGREGKILVSSNKNDPTIGFDVSFRDYFKLAMNGQSSDMIDYGKVTRQLGFYSIHPVIRPRDKTVLGVCVVKRNLDDLQDLLKLYHPAMIVDEAGAVFIASDKEFEQHSFIPCLIEEPHNHPETITGSASLIIAHQAYAEAMLNKKGWRVVMLSVGRADSTDSLWLMITLSLVSLSIILVLNSTVISIRSHEDYEVAEERFQTVFYHAPESMLIISARSLEILEANHSMKRQFELSGEIIGTSYLSLLPADRHDIANIWHDRAEKVFKHQRTFVKSNGEVFTAEVTGAPITFNYQKAIIILLHDTTAQKQIEFELRQAKNAAEEANKLKSRFFANASHEIRTPMTAIIGLTEMALTMCRSAEQERLLKLTRSSSRSLLELVNDILDLSRIESGKFSIRPCSFDLHQLLQELDQLYEFEAKGSRVNVSFVLDPELPHYIVSDPVRLRQILLNLLSNALKYTDNGKIGLQAKIKDDGKREILEIRVHDTGRGISREVQEHLFEPFTFSDQYTRRAAKGAGLGLAISRQIADLLEGRLTLEKTSSEGSLFVLEIPFGRVEGAQAAVEPTTAQIRLVHSSCPLHFLIADDNEINLFLAGSIIEKFGGTHRYARDGNEAYSLLKSEKFDIALIDIQMPELDGLSLIKLLRQNDSPAAGIPIIAVSAFISDEEKQEALQAGADSYLVKPYFPHDLLQIVYRYTDGTVTREDNPQPENDTPATTSGDRPVIKQINMAELEIRILKKPENIRKISEIFSRRSEELMKDLTACEQNSDGARLREVIHSIKGLVGMLGARNTFELARELEEHCKNGRLTPVFQQLNALRQQIGEIAEDLDILQQNDKKTV